MQLQYQQNQRLADQLYGMDYKSATHEWKACGLGAGLGMLEWKTTFFLPPKAFIDYPIAPNHLEVLSLAIFFFLSVTQPGLLTWRGRAMASESSGTSLVIVEPAAT